MQELGRAVRELISEEQQVELDHLLDLYEGKELGESEFHQEMCRIAREDIVHDALRAFVPDALDVQQEHGLPAAAAGTLPTATSAGGSQPLHPSAEITAPRPSGSTQPRRVQHGHEPVPVAAVSELGPARAEASGEDSETEAWEAIEGMSAAGSEWELLACDDDAASLSFDGGSLESVSSRASAYGDGSACGDGPDADDACSLISDSTHPGRAALHDEAIETVSLPQGSRQPPQPPTASPADVRSVMLDVVRRLDPRLSRADVDRNLCALLESSDARTIEATVPQLGRALHCIAGSPARARDGRPMDVHIVRVLYGLERRLSMEIPNLLPVFIEGIGGSRRAPISFTLDQVRLYVVPCLMRHLRAEDDVLALTAAMCLARVIAGLPPRARRAVVDRVTLVKREAQGGSSESERVAPVLRCAQEAADLLSARAWARAGFLRAVVDAAPGLFFSLDGASERLALQLVGDAAPRLVGLCDAKSAEAEVGVAEELAHDEDGHGIGRVGAGVGGDAVPASAASIEGAAALPRPCLPQPPELPPVPAPRPEDIEFARFADRVVRAAMKGNASASGSCTYLPDACRALERIDALRGEGDSRYAQAAAQREIAAELERLLAEALEDGEGDADHGEPAPPDSELCRPDPRLAADFDRLWGPFADEESLRESWLAHGRTMRALRAGAVEAAAEAYASAPEVRVGAAPQWAADVGNVLACARQGGSGDVPSLRGHAVLCDSVLMEVLFPGAEHAFELVAIDFALGDD